MMASMSVFSGPDAPLAAHTPGPDMTTPPPAWTQLPGRP